MKSGPPPWLEERRIETATITGSAASTPIPAMLRRRPKMILSSDRRNRLETRARCEVPTTRRSAADIESLARQRHEHVFQARLQHREPEHGYAGVHQIGHDLLDRNVIQRRRQVASRAFDVSQPELGQHPHRILGPVGVDAYGLDRVGSELAERSLRHQSALKHHPKMAADLLDLGEQMT